MSRSLTNAEVNHLRRLVGWIRSDVGQSPEEMRETIRQIAPVIQDASDEGKGRLVEAYRKAENVPKYILAAIKALEKTIKEVEGDVVDAEAEKNRLTAEPLRLP